MSLSSSNPVFVAYVVSCLVLIVHLAFLWNWSGLVRGQLKLATNPEDVRRGVTVADEDPPEVQRAMRVYANAMSVCVPFFVLGLLFVACGGGLLFGEIAFGTFVATRLLYAVVYLRGVQPWRSIFYTLSCVVLLTLMSDIVYLLVRH